MKSLGFRFGGCARRAGDDLDRDKAFYRKMGAFFYFSKYGSTLQCFAAMELVRLCVLK